jgi:hypothetical protein
MRKFFGLVAGLVAIAATAGSAQAAEQQDGVAAPTLLFVQDATSGTFVPAAKRGVHWLTFHGVKPRVLAFENRPGDLKMTMTTQRMIDVLWAKGSAPPNAAVDAWDPVRGQDVVMGVKLLSARYDAKRQVMRYRVKALRDAPGSKPHTQVNTTLPRRFGEAGVFIDDLSSSRTCSGWFQNRTSYTFGLSRDGNVIAEPDGWPSGGGSRWDIGYPGDFINPGGYSQWMSRGGFLKGCYNRVKYENAQGSVTLGMDDPYRGSNDWNCTTTGIFGCRGPLYGSEPYGDNLYLVFEIYVK